MSIETIAWQILPALLATVGAAVLAVLALKGPGERRQGVAARNLAPARLVKGLILILVLAAAAFGLMYLVGSIGAGT